MLSILQVEVLITLVVMISNSKFGCFSFFSFNFSNNMFPKILLPVKATYFAGTTSPTSLFLFPITNALSLFLGAAFKKFVSKQESSIGKCPTSLCYLISRFKDANGILIIFDCFFPGVCFAYILIFVQHVVSKCLYKYDVPELLSETQF